MLLNVSRGEIDLTPRSAYDCRKLDALGNLVAQLKWQPGSPGTLTIKGVIYFDAHLSWSNLNLIQYDGKAVIYGSGQVRIKNRADICGVPACDATWDPRVDLLVFVAGSLISQVVDHADRRRHRQPRQLPGRALHRQRLRHGQQHDGVGAGDHALDDDQQLRARSTRRRFRSSGCTGCRERRRPSPRSSRSRELRGLADVNAAAAAFVLAPALALGSFLNVVVARVPARRSILRPPSSCGTCATEILWRDNIPVLSYLLLRGRCRHCDARISPVYPLVEAVTALLIVTCVAVYGPTPEAALAAGFCAVLVTLSVIDARHRIVPNRIVAAGGSRRPRRAHGDRPEPRVARLVADRGGGRCSSSCSPIRGGSAWGT